jgi:hypothetical protein
MSKAAPKTSIDLLTRFVDKAIIESTGRLSKASLYDDLVSLAKAVDQDALIEETCWSVINKSWAKHTKVALKKNADWIGYGDVFISENDEGILTKNAVMSDLMIRSGHVIENVANVTAAASIELRRINRIQTVMYEQSFTTAGEALAWLAANGEPF